MRLPNGSRTESEQNNFFINDIVTEAYKMRNCVPSTLHFTLHNSFDKNVEHLIFLVIFKFSLWQKPFLAVRPLFRPLKSIPSYITDKDLKTSLPSSLWLTLNMCFAWWDAFRKLPRTNFDKVCHSFELRGWYFLILLITKNSVNL